MKYLKHFESKDFYLFKEIEKYVVDELSSIIKYTDVHIINFNLNENNILSFYIHIEQLEDSGMDVITHTVNPGPLDRHMESLRESLLEDFVEEFEEVEMEKSMSLSYAWQYTYECHVKKDIARSGKTGLWDLKNK